MTFDAARHYERVPFAARVTVADAASGARYEGNSIDLSAGGVGFYTRRFFEPGARIRVSIWLTVSGRQEPVELPATVRWARVEQGGAIMGAEFDAVLSAARQPTLWERLCAK